MIRRKLAFVLASTDHGSMIVNRMDYHLVQPNQGIGVGLQLLETASFDADEVDLALKLLDLRRKSAGDGLVAIDCGANIGVHTLEWAKRMTDWGTVIAFEAQERIYYALAGNIALNNLFNARAIHAALGARRGKMKMPNVDHRMPSSFGSLELKKRDRTEFIGQAVNYAEDSMVEVRTETIDSLALARADFIKIDVEGMELEVLEGAARTIKSHRPFLLVESIKTDKSKLQSWFDNIDYVHFEIGINLLAVHEEDPSLSQISPKRT